MEFKELITAFATKYGIKGLDGVDGVAELDVEGVRVELLDDHHSHNLFACAEIHHAISQFSENIVTAMGLSEAEAKTDGANEKQACRNFIAAVMMGRCGGAKTLRAMQGAFAGDTPAKMLVLYESIVNSKQNEGVEQRLIVPFENLAANHMMNIANLKGAIDVALDGDFGADIVPFDGEFDADEISAEEIINDLLNHA